MCNYEQRIIELKKHGASEEEIEAAKWALVESRFEGMDEPHILVSVAEFQRMEAAGECTDNILLDGKEFRKALNAGVFDDKNHQRKRIQRSH